MIQRPATEFVNSGGDRWEMEFRPDGSVWLHGTDIESPAPIIDDHVGLLVLDDKEFAWARRAYFSLTGRELQLPACQRARHVKQLKAE